MKFPDGEYSAIDRVGSVDSENGVRFADIEDIF
jgi:hypothetical protein